MMAALLDPREQERLVAEAQRLLRGVRENYLRVGAVLIGLRDGLASTRFDAALREIGVNLRTAFALIRAVTAAPVAGLTREEAIALGWTKLNLVAVRLGQGEDAYWIEQARTQSAATLSKMVSENRSGARPANVFLLTSEQKGALDAALFKAGAKRHGRGLRGREEALMAILVMSGLSSVQKFRTQVRTLAVEEVA